MDKIRVLIVDDHAMVRRGLQSLLSLYRDIEVVGEAGDAASAVQAAVELSPEVILLDIRLPGPSGIEAAKRLRKEAPEARIIALTAHDNDEYILEALGAGVRAYLLKSTADETVVETIRLVHQGKRLLSPALMDKVLQQFEDLIRPQAGAESDLSRRELRVLELIAQGATNEEIAQEMNCSERTIKRKIARITSVLGARNRAQAVAEGVKRGLI